MTILINTEKIVIIGIIMTMRELDMTHVVAKSRIFVLLDQEAYFSIQST